MTATSAYLAGLLAMCLVAAGVWLASVRLRDVSIVDSFWSLFFLLGTIVYAIVTPDSGPRAVLLIALVGAWALRLAGYITWRNHGTGEDIRYVAMRERNGESFTYTSLYRVFILQAVLAWFISQPLLAGVIAGSPLNWLDAAGVAVWALGFFFETVGDYQLAAFKANPDNKGKVMDRGLWRYTRHPNYFGDFCVWWGFYLIAVAGGGWWTIAAPALMSFLLLKVSGVALLEKDIGNRRPGYAEYVRSTNAFFPGPPRAAGLNEPVNGDI
ncbi:MAG: DUF1295 domain-containing protein [Pseudomonadota bacterium]